MTPSLVVIFREDAAVEGRSAREPRISASELRSLDALMLRHGARLAPLFQLSASEHELRGWSVPGLPDLSAFHRVEAPRHTWENLLHELRARDSVEAAYLKPAAQPAVASNPQKQQRALGPREDVSRTPDFVSLQEYLGPAPGGIGAKAAWRWLGGGGAGIRIIDIENGWDLTHEDLSQNVLGLRGSQSPSTDLKFRNHGTAVLGELTGDRNGFGVTGICPEAAIAVVPAMSSSSEAIQAGAQLLLPGDLLLLEMHRPGPRFGFHDNQKDQLGFIAVEWWPDDYRAIRYATDRGIIVVGAAGNGSEDLDDPLYDRSPGFPYGPFPSWWSNPFRRSPLDSGAILVGAGCPPPGVHGNYYGVDRSRLDLSNHGASIDAQGWGTEVTTTGYGTQPGGGPTEDGWYATSFGGTSAASPIVVGALACVQGSRRARGYPLWTPARARERLRATGSPQQPDTGHPLSQRIGNRPDLVQLLGPPLVGGPALINCAWGAAVVFHSDTAGHVLFYDSWKRHDLTALTGAPTARGDVAGCYLGGPMDNLYALFFTGTDGCIHQLSRAPSKTWTHQNLFDGLGAAPPPSGNVSAISYGGGNDGKQTLAVFYRGEDGRLHQLFWREGSTWAHVDLNAKAGGLPRAATDPIANWGPLPNAGHTGTTVTYAGDSGHIYQLESTDLASWTYLDLTLRTSASRCIGELCQFKRAYTEGFDVFAVDVIVYRTLGRAVCELWRDRGGSWRARTLETQFGQIEAELCCAAFPATRSNGRPTHNLLHIGKDGRLYQLSWELAGAPTSMEVAPASGAPLPVGPATGLGSWGYNDLDPYRALFFIGTDGHLHSVELLSSPSPHWRWKDLSALP